MTLRALCDAMITVSSNLAANNLIGKLGVKNIQATTDSLGAAGMQVLRGVEDQKAFDAGKNNTADATGLLMLFQRIGRGEAVNAAASAAMVEILKRQTFNDGIPAGVPPGMPVAHKTGTITAFTTTRASSTPSGRTCSWYSRAGSPTTRSRRSSSRT